MAATAVSRENVPSCAWGRGGSEVLVSISVDEAREAKRGGGGDNELRWHSVVPLPSTPRGKGTGVLGRGMGVLDTPPPPIDTDDPEEENNFAGGEGRDLGEDDGGRLLRLRRDRLRGGLWSITNGGCVGWRGSCTLLEIGSWVA